MTLYATAPMIDNISISWPAEAAWAFLPHLLEAV